MGNVYGSSGTLVDWVGTTDTNDYYRVNFVDSRNVNLTLTGMSANADLMVYAADGTTVVASSTNIGNSNEAINLNVASGTYYVRVQAVTGPTYYQLDSATRPISDTAGNTIAAALDIGTLNAYAQYDSSWMYYEGWVGDTDINDCYRFTLGGTRNLQLNLRGMDSDADVVIYGSDGATVIGESHNRGIDNERININNLTAGTYYARVYYYVPNGRNTDYDLLLSARMPGEPLNDGSPGDDSWSDGPGNNTWSGGPGNDWLLGGAGNDTLIGDAGNDTLTGGLDADIFRFTTTINSGIDTITDFQPGTDRIQIVSPNFANIPVGTLAANRLVAAGTTLTTGNAVFIYNGTTGGLAFDRDGNGSAAAVQFATLTGHPTLRATDFQVVAA